jgi:para-aminobenzoate synthetase component I
MRIPYNIKDISKEQVLLWMATNTHSTTCILNSNLFNGKINLLIGLDVIDEIHTEPNNSFNALKIYHEQHQDWILGYLTYDLKNETEKLESENPDGLNWPVLHFFRPKYLFIFSDASCKLMIHQAHCSDIDQLISSIRAYKPLPSETPLKLSLQKKINKEEYCLSVQKIKKHIQQGDVYELNFCQEFFSKKATIDPYLIYLKLNNLSKMPYSCYYHLGNNYLMCASPERFLKKEGNKIISQPIKGTIKRGTSEVEDRKLKKQLLQNQKERSENVMIVDLVRNDLSKTAVKGSVKVEELYGIYSFDQVHQMISTVSAELHPKNHFSEAIKHCFPMGSMTGAPKLKAMELIEKFETSKRGLFSGAVGYINPEGDFDFNVVIRSIQYNVKNKYLSFMVGSAITANSIPEKEYEECLLKAKAIFQALNIQEL